MERTQKEKKLYEEFKEYEHLWEEADPVNQILSEIGDIEFEYDGFETDWCEHVYSPAEPYGDREIGGTNQYSEFTYKRDADWVFSDLAEVIIPEHADKVPANDLLNEYMRLAQAVDNATDSKTQDAYLDEQSLLLAKNLKAFVEMFYKYLLEYYAEDAQEWATENLEPYEDFPEYDDDDDEY